MDRGTFWGSAVSPGGSNSHEKNCPHHGWKDPADSGRASSKYVEKYTHEFRQLYPSQAHSNVFFFFLFFTNHAEPHAEIWKARQAVHPEIVPSLSQRCRDTLRSPVWAQQGVGRGGGKGMHLFLWAAAPGAQGEGRELEDFTAGPLTANDCMRRTASPVMFTPKRATPGSPSSRIMVGGSSASL